MLAGAAWMRRFAPAVASEAPRGGPASAEGRWFNKNRSTSMSKGIGTHLSCLAVAMFLLSPFAAAGDDGLKLGVIPLESPKVMYKQFAPLAQYLSKELGVKVQIVIGKDYQATMDALGSNEVHFAYLTPTTYPKCERQNPDSGIRPLVRFLKSGKGTYRSCIVVPADSDVSSVDQLKGKKFAFGSEDSTSSHLMPRSMLISNGVDIDKDLAGYEYLGTHTNVAMAVKMKKFDGGGVKESVAEAGEKAGDLKIIARSKDIPEFPICVNKHMSDEMVAKLTQAFAKLKDSDASCKTVLASINKKYTGCETAQSGDYDPVREMIASVYGDAFYGK
jgi:phosphonate transport system substrate-binding protein